jgi:hypothetical protein
VQIIPDDIEDEKERIQETIDALVDFFDRMEVKPATAFSSINYIMFHMLDNIFTASARKNIASALIKKLEEHFINEKDNSRDS